MVGVVGALGSQRLEVDVSVVGAGAGSEAGVESEPLVLDGVLDRVCRGVHCRFGCRFGCEALEHAQSHRGGFRWHFGLPVRGCVRLEGAIRGVDQVQPLEDVADVSLELVKRVRSRGKP